MRAHASRNETLLFAACVALAALALFGPAVSQPAHAHSFADQRALWGIPFALDVLSNLPFALMGLAGAFSLGRLPGRALGNVQRAMAALFFGGLLLTAAASGWYHLRPDDAGLLVDRSGMAVAFAGLLGLCAATRISDRAGAALGLALLVLAPASVQAWAASGDVLPWAVVQFGGMLLVVVLAGMRGRPAALDVRWGWVIAAYAAAKLLETQDHAIFELTGQLVSGHTLKHLAACLAALPVIAAVWRLGNPRQNAFAIQSHA